METKTVEAQFVNKLALVKEEGRKHSLYYVYDGEQSITRTQISRGHKEISEDIFRKIAEQLFLKMSELRAAINCPMSKKDFYKIVIERWKEKYYSKR